MYDFGNTLKKLRTEKKLSQKELALKLNINHSMISRYENDGIYPPFETLRALSSILNVSLDELCSIQTPGTISLYGLNQEQVEIVKKLIATFRNDKALITKNLTVEQNTILGQIVTEFLK